MRRRSSSSDVALILAGAALAGASVAACGSRAADKPDAGAAATPTAVTASARATPSTSASAVAPSALRRDAGGGPDFESGECADFEPSRWAAIERYDPETHCWVFTPSSKETMPRPYAWEPCGRDDFGPKCRRLRLAPRENVLAQDGARRLLPGRAPRLEILRQCAGLNSEIHSIADVDGPTRVAIAQDSEWQCTFSALAMREGYALKIAAQKPSDDPKAVDEWGQPAMMQVDVDDALLAFDSVTPKPRGSTELTPFEPKAFPRYSYGAPAEKALRASAQAIVGIATDGTDLAWVVPDPADKDRFLLLRAPYQDRAADLIGPTRVASIASSEVEHYGGKPVAGCGHFGATAVDGRAFVVRMKDGASFHFPRLCGPLDTDSRCSTQVLGFSCSEAFLAVGGPKPNVFRVALDAMPNLVKAEEPPRPLDPPDAGSPDDGGAADGGPLDAGPAARLDAGK